MAARASSTGSGPSPSKNLEMAIYAGGEQAISAELGKHLPGCSIANDAAEEWPLMGLDL